MKLRVLAHAKLNLCLRVVGRREDGFHLLQSLVAAVDLCDEILLFPQRAGIELAAPADLGPREENLAVRAARALLPTASPGVRIVLHKRIPPGAGLGGGSADAAAVLAGLNELFSLGRTPRELAEIGVKLGADVPFFFGPCPAWVEGIGERITPLDLPLPPAFLILVPPIRCPTPDVYQAFDDLGLPISPSTPSPRELTMGNDLWPAAVRLAPALLPLREELARVSPGPVGMTGSGSALFAPFPSPAEARHARDRLWGHVDGELFVASPIGSGYRIAR